MGSSGSPLTEEHKAALDNCTQGMKKEIERIKSDERDILCAVVQRTQKKLPNLRMDFFSSDTHMSNDSRGTGTENEVDTLQCSSSQPSTLTSEQLIERIQQMVDRLKSMESGTNSNAYNMAMSCANSRFPNRNDIGRAIGEKFSMVMRNMKNFTDNAVKGKLVSSHSPRLTYNLASTTG